MPLNDLLNLGDGGGQKLERAPVQRNAEPPLTATPRANCEPGSRREPGIQGRVPEDTAANGLWCNLKLLAHQGASGGFKVHRYVDVHGRECAYYDTSLLVPVSALKVDTNSNGVAVLDMSNPSRPIQTAILRSPPMISPHESLSVNQKRGLIAAVLGNPAFHPGLMAIYDAREDCRHPVHQSTAPVARLGHESNFSPDGRTFYSASGAKSVTAVDVEDPKNPRPVWQGALISHGLTLNEDGTRAYVADVSNGNMLVLDTSEIQARKDNPQAREISRITWKSASLPQNAIPFRRGRKLYVLEIDEYNASANVYGPGNRNQVGAARIIDISDERKPRVVSNLRLQVHQPAAHEAASEDPGARSPVQGYAGHYCNVPPGRNPLVVACSFITSGLRVFDISNLEQPEEIAYHVAPTRSRSENGYMASAYAMSKPVIVPSRREVWYTDGTTGFYALRVSPDAWPAAETTRKCLARRSAIGPRNIGRVRIGYTRRRLRRLPVRTIRRTRYSYRYCVKGRTGRVRAVFSSRRRRARAILVATTAPGHGNRGVRVRSRASAFRRAYPGRRKLVTGIYRASGTSTRLIGVRDGRVRFVAVAKRSLLSKPRALRRALRRAGL